jgi:hypothetical protein
MSIRRRQVTKEAWEMSLCPHMRLRDGGKANSFPEAVKCLIEMDAIEGDETERVAHLGALLGFRPSTIHSCLPCLQRMQMFSPEGK